MKITKEFEGLKRLDKGDYVLDGDLVSEDNIEIELVITKDAQTECAEHSNETNDIQA